MTNDTGNNNTSILITFLIAAGITTFLCSFVFKAASCNRAVDIAECERDAKIKIEDAKIVQAKYSAMAECIKVKTYLECKDLFAETK